MNNAPPFLIAGFGIACYFIPTIIASGRSHHNAVAIAALNVLLGWTFIGWVVGLVWACSSQPKARRQTESARIGDSVTGGNKYDHLERLAKLKADGVLSELEYEKEKRLLLG